MPRSKRLLPITASIFVLFLLVNPIFEYYAAQTVTAANSAHAHLDIADKHRWAGKKIVSGAHMVWDPADSLYVTGQPRGYTAGDTAAFRVMVNGAADGEKLKFMICLASDASGALAFTMLDSWDKSVSPDPPPNNIHSTHPPSGVQASNAVLDAVTFIGEDEAYGAVSCGPEYLSWLVQFTIVDASLPAYIVYGGRLAEAGGVYRQPVSALEPAAEEKKAAAVDGAFQAKIASVGQGENVILFNETEISTPELFPNAR